LRQNVFLSVSLIIAFSLVSIFVCLQILSQR